MSTNHCWYQLLCIFINFVAVVCTILVIISGLGIQYGFTQPIPEILKNGTFKVDGKYSTPITPASWIHVTWLVAYFWMLIWSVHAMISVCRKFAGVPVYVSPTLINTPMLLLTTGACGVTVAWYCVYDREYIATATLFAFCVTCFSWTAYVLSVYSLHTNVYRLEKGERTGEAWLHICLVQNGLALLGMWAFFVTVFNLCTALVHNEGSGVDQDSAAVICLSIVAFYLILYVTLDVSALDRFTRYTCVHYLVPIVVLCACIFHEDEWKNDSVVFIMLATLVAFSFLQIMLKAACVACRIMMSDEDDHFQLGDPQDDPHMSSASSTGYIQEGHYLMRK